MSLSGATSDMGIPVDGGGGWATHPWFSRWIERTIGDSDSRGGMISKIHVRVVRFCSTCNVPPDFRLYEGQDGLLDRLTDSKILNLHYRPERLVD